MISHQTKESTISSGATPAKWSVVTARNLRQLAQLPRREQPVGDGDTQHGRVALDVQAVAQAQRPELVLAQLAVEEAPCLVAELRHPLVHQPVVDLVVDVHVRQRWAPQ